MPFRPIVGDTIISADGLELNVVKVSIDFKRHVVVHLYLPEIYNVYENPTKEFYRWYKEEFKKKLNRG